MKDTHIAQHAGQAQGPRILSSPHLIPTLVRCVLIGVALECLYLLVCALAPIATVYSQVFPPGQAWSWTLALSHLLFPGAWAGNSPYPASSPYFLLLGLTFIALGCVYLYAVISASRTNTGLLLPLIGALLFGITLLFLPALFSTDIFTYSSASHLPNLYYGPPFSTLAPQFPPTPNYGGVLTHFKPVLYGPLWLGIASLLTRISSDFITVVLLFRGLALLVHLINCVLVWAILSKIAPAHRLTGALLYAWNPLVLIELVANGHNDGVAICLLLLAVWFYVHQRGKWFDGATLLCCGLAISTNLMVLLIAPLLLWFMVRNQRYIIRAIVGFSWRALLVLAIVCIAYAPTWQGGTTFLAITSSIDLQNFMYSLLALLVTPLRALYTQLTGGINLPSSLLQPVAAADTTILASTLFIFALLYFQAMGKVRSPWGGWGGPYHVLFTCWTVVIIGFVALASTLFWPWYIIWVVWIVALRRLDTLTIGVLLLSCTALLYYPLLRLDTTPLGIYVPLCIFVVPLIYLITQRYLPPKRASRSHGKGGGGADAGLRSSRSP